jgi:hypothetical protein
MVLTAERPAGAVSKAFHHSRLKEKRANTYQRDMNKYMTIS